MITRVHGRIVFECDDCGELLETGVADFTEANIARREEHWTSQKVSDVWMHYCEECAASGHDC